LPVKQDKDQIPNEQSAIQDEEKDENKGEKT